MFSPLSYVTRYALVILGFFRALVTDLDLIVLSWLAIAVGIQLGLLWGLIVYLSAYVIFRAADRYINAIVGAIQRGQTRVIA